MCADNVINVCRYDKTVDSMVFLISQLKKCRGGVGNPCSTILLYLSKLFILLYYLDDIY